MSGTATNFYNMRGGRFWNGEVIRVNPSHQVCGMDFATAATKTVPASIRVVDADASCTPKTNSAVFEWGGGSYTGNSTNCNGFRSKSQLIPCDLKSPPAPLQFTTISPYIDDEFPLDAGGDPKDWSGDGTRDYLETQDGSWSVSSISIAPSARAAGSTPIANSLIDIKGAADAGDTSCITNAEAIYPALDLNTGATTTAACGQRNFSKMWNTGPSDAGTPPMPPTLGAGPWAGVPVAQRAIQNHNNPKEKTIVVFVTDGDDTCGSRTNSVDSSAFRDDIGGDREARRAAYYAEELYRPINAAEPASSVQTYVVGYGGAFASGPYRLDWIAWGGSGLGQTGQPNVDWQTDDEATIKSQRSKCSTCTDAFVAPDATTLAASLQSIIDQGASDGDFNAQQSITESVYEYVHVAATGTTLYDAAKPGLRYKAIVPTRFISSFTLPGFKGQQRAYQNDGSGGTVQKWSAGDTLRTQVATTMASGDSFGAGACNALLTGGGPIDECPFYALHGGATDANIRTSAARIKRRIYTTSGNGVFPYTVDRLIDGTTTDSTSATGRVALWPPTAAGLLATSLTDDTYKGYDAALRLPPDTPTSFPPNPVDPKCDPADTRPTIATPKKAYNECWYGWLQTRFGACLGNNLQAACTDPSYAVSMRAARREAREISLAFLAGATTVANTGGTGIRRATAAFSGGQVGSIVYKARPWILADSELATAAVVTPPLPAEPTATPYVDEYRLFRDGPRSGGTNPERSVGAPAQVKMGFGLTAPDADGTVATAAVDPKIGLKPVMTVLYAPANDMLHAFRAGPCDTPALSVPCNETGGEELWGFVPYDQLHTVMLRAAHEPQGKTNHVYSLARGARFSDVFIPGAYSRTLGTGSVSSTQGVWRRVLFIGRGVGGKYMTAIDVTAPGPYTEYALSTRPPEPLWSRGNPDTRDGTPAGAANGNGTDTAGFAKMGETWSIPVVAYVDKTNAIYAGLDYVLFMGSGYSAVASEGSTFFTLDALTGKVVATADVAPRSGFGAYPNALVANAVGFNPKIFSPLTTVHPAASQVTARLHRRRPRPPVEVPDGTPRRGAADRRPRDGPGRRGGGFPARDAAAARHPGAPDLRRVRRRQAGGRPLPDVRLQGHRDGHRHRHRRGEHGRHRDDLPAGGAACSRVSTTRARPTPAADTPPRPSSGARFSRRRHSSAARSRSDSARTPVGRIFYAGTRLSLPNTRFAPITPLACGSGVYPCRSVFDSIIYALGAESGLPAYDLNAAGDDAYRIFRDSRIAAITVQADPDPGRGGSSFTPDEGLMKGTPKPPPPPGVPPTATTATANVLLTREPGQPAPAIRYGSTVCQ